MSGYCGNDDIEVYSFTVCPFSSHAAVVVYTASTFVFAHFFFVWNIRCTNPNSNETEIFLRRSWAHVNNSTCTFTYYADRIRRVRREIEMKSHTYRFHDCVFHSRYSTVMVQLKMAILRASQLHQTNRSIYVQFVVWFIIQIRANTQYITSKQTSKQTYVCIPRWHIYTIAQHFIDSSYTKFIQFHIDLSHHWRSLQWLFVWLWHGVDNNKISIQWM